MSSEAGKLPWGERVTMLSIHPDAATRDDVARIASDLLELNQEVLQLRTENEALRTDLKELKKGHAEHMVPRDEAKRAVDELRNKITTLKAELDAWEVTAREINQYIGQPNMTPLDDDGIGAIFNENKKAITIMNSYGQATPTDDAGE